MFLDIGIGILLSIWTSWFFHADLTFALVLAGIAFALLPDIDFFVELIKHGSVGGKVIREHRELTHFPIIYIPIAIFIFIVYGAMWVTLFGLCILAHFIHDSIGMGWGIQWFWPFKADHYAFLYLYKPKHGNALPKKIFYIWKHEDINAIAEKYGDPEWIKNIYLQFHPIAVIEFSFLIISLIILYLYLN